MSLGTRLFVNNLPDNADDNDLRSAFSKFGEVNNLDLKSKSASSNEQKKFAFVTLSASNYDVESCIKYFTNEDFKGNRLYVTRARESFLERLQREREQAQKKEAEKNEQEPLPEKDPVIKLSNKLNPQKRKLDNNYSNEAIQETTKVTKFFERKKHVKPDIHPDNGASLKEPITEKEKKKYDSEQKRIESMKKKRQEFNAKRMIIKTGLIDVDKVQNKKVIFSDNDEESSYKSNGHVEITQMQDKKNTLFDDDDSGDDVNFEVKKQFEGKKGQKVLDLQSRYKSDKRFMLDERFMDNNHSEDEEQEGDDNEQVDLSQTDEKAKQYNILQNVLGISIKQRNHDSDNKNFKPKLGMLRFDPSQPEHARFLMPIEEIKREQTKKNKKKKEKKGEIKEALDVPAPLVEKVVVSKEQFYKVSDTLKEAIAQPTTFSLRSLFANNEDVEKGPQEQDNDYIPLATQSKTKIKNPLDTGEKNPFVYDSSDSETEEVDTVEVKPEELSVPTEIKAVWKENLFFSNTDIRLTEALAFFNKTNQSDAPKERRELKSLMKKRIYNKERKNQMFQKKIGGRKSLKKNYRKKS